MYAHLSNRLQNSSQSHILEKLKNHFSYLQEEQVYQQPGETQARQCKGLCLAKHPGSPCSGRWGGFVLAQVWSNQRTLKDLSSSLGICFHYRMEPTLNKWGAGGFHRSRSQLPIEEKTPSLYLSAHAEFNSKSLHNPSRIESLPDLRGKRKTLLI